MAGKYYNIIPAQSNVMTKAVPGIHIAAELQHGINKTLTEKLCILALNNSI